MFVPNAYREAHPLPGINLLADHLPDHVLAGRFLDAAVPTLPPAASSVAGHIGRGDGLTAADFAPAAFPSWSELFSDEAVGG